MEANTINQKKEKRVAFVTLGCRVNQYESTALSELFLRNGYEIAGDGEKADICVINTCAVTAESERKSAQMIRRALKTGAKVAVVGCYSQLDSTLGGIKGVSFIGGNKDKTAVFYEAERLLSQENEPLIADSNLSGCIYENMSIGIQPTEIFSSCRAFIKIQDGCNGRCSYCIIPTVRGRVRSRPMSEITEEVSRLAKLGYKEVVLTGIETSAYDFAPLSELIKQIDAVEGIERLRFGSLSPNTITDDFLKAAKESRCFMPHIHLSLQSGSDRILKLMRRPYNKKQMCKKIEMIYEYLPNALISSDLIVGFPTETYEEFCETLDIVKDYRLSHVHAFPFSPRPGTEAAKMDGKIPKSEIKKRNEILIETSAAVKNTILESKTGKQVKVLVEKVENGMFTGHTEDFLEARFTSAEHCDGDIVNIVINSFSEGILSGDII